jgi:hypothetical protein
MRDSTQDANEPLTIFKLTNNNSPRLIKQTKKFHRNHQKDAQRNLSSSSSSTGIIEWETIKLPALYRGELHISYVDFTSDTSII